MFYCVLWSGVSYLFQTDGLGKFVVSVFAFVSLISLFSLCKHGEPGFWTLYRKEGKESRRKNVTRVAKYSVLNMKFLHCSLKLEEKDQSLLSLPGPLPWQTASPSVENGALVNLTYTWYFAWSFFLVFFTSVGSCELAHMLWSQMCTW